MEVIANTVIPLDRRQTAALPDDAGGDIEPEDLPFD
jgi:hypothetical protein